MCYPSALFLSPRQHAKVNLLSMSLSGNLLMVFFFFFDIVRIQKLVFTLCHLMRNYTFCQYLDPPLLSIVSSGSNPSVRTSILIVSRCWNISQETRKYTWTLDWVFRSKEWWNSNWRRLRYLLSSHNIGTWNLTHVPSKIASHISVFKCYKGLIASGCEAKEQVWKSIEWCKEIY